jgi:ketosteroid isomerase-like protein
MTHETFQVWLDRYIAAWRSGSAEDIAALFSEDVVYTYRPFRPSVRGRDAVVASWLENPDEPGTWSAEYHPLAVDGEVAVSIGETHYPSEDRTYSNIFVCRFNDENECSEFSEWWVEKPSPKAEA